MENEKDRIVKKFQHLSDKYHKLSLLMYELGKSISFEIEKKNIERSRAKIKAYLKTLNLDYDKIIKLSRGIKEIEYKDLKK